TTHIPVLLVSRASVDDGLVAKLFDAGADDYIEIQQPGELLARKAGRLLELHRVQRGRRRAEQALRESVEQYRLFFEANPQPMWVYDRDTLAVLAVNEATIRNYGYSRSEFMSMKITDFRPEEDIPRLLSEITAARSGFKAQQPWRHRLKDGRIISVEISSNDLMFLGKRARLVLASDVTERQRAEEALRESEERFAKAFQANPDPMSIHRFSDGMYIDVNRSFLNVTGFSREEVVGRTVDEVNMVVDQQARAVWRRMMLESGSIRNWETQFRVKSGEIRWGLMSAEAI